MASEVETKYFEDKAKYDDAKIARTEARAENVQTMDGDDTELRKLNKFGKGVKQAEKINNISWHPIGTGSEIACLALQDGKAITYNVKSGQMLNLHSLTTWMNVCEFSPSGNQLAVGGLDNLVTIFKMPDFATNEGGDDKPLKVFEKHGGPIYDIKWLDENVLVSGSGDKCALVWDVTKGGGLVKEPEVTFRAHDSDISTIATWKGETNCFLTGSGDTFIKMNDKRVVSKTHSGSVMTFAGHTKAVTKIAMLPVGGNNSFGSVSEDGTMRLWDIRTMTQIQQIGEAADDDEEGNTEWTALAFSKSGRMAFVGTDSGEVDVYDVLSGKNLQTLKHHNAKIKALELSLDGYVFGSCSMSAESNNNFALWA